MPGTMEFTWSMMIQAGGPVLILLIFFLLAALVAITERWMYFKNLDRGKEHEEILRLVSAGKPSEAISYARSARSPVSYVLAECLSGPGEKPQDENFSDRFEEVRSRAIAEKIPELERFFTLLATLGSVSPFIGLLGTVFGIIRAFVELGGGGRDLSGLNAGIAEALVATAAGLLVAIPATFAYNFLKKKAEANVLSMEVQASRLKELLR
ncbi:MAG TPA: hypothetical protein DEA96_07540 [Leptospiraceae bacterium]|nr:hypothetical protein [Spirochaetaceae bacterium]HBS04798.1 hypothetical protein [Leptospiraceae bacterium]